MRHHFTTTEHHHDHDGSQSFVSVGQPRAWRPRVQNVSSKLTIQNKERMVRALKNAKTSKTASNFPKAAAVKNHHGNTAAAQAQNSERLSNMTAAEQRKDAWKAPGSGDLENKLRSDDRATGTRELARDPRSLTALSRVSCGGSPGPERVDSLGTLARPRRCRALTMGT